MRLRTVPDLETFLFFLFPIFFGLTARVIPLRSGLRVFCFVGSALNRVTRYQPTPQEQAQWKKEALAERIDKLSRVRILETIRKKLPDVFSRPDLEVVALDYFRRLGHDNHRRLSKLYAWEEKKSKTSWSAQTVDYEKMAASAVQAMKAADLNRFLVVCSLVSDLYCTGYNPRQSLEKNSNLARAAARYKFDSAKIATAHPESEKRRYFLKRKSRALRLGYSGSFPEPNHN